VLRWAAAPSPASPRPRTHRHRPPDELIRQVTINCAERGLLLLRVRDEIRMAMASYQARTDRLRLRAVPVYAGLTPTAAATTRAQTLYESSIAYGMRKALQAEQDRQEMEAQVRRPVAFKNPRSRPDARAMHADPPA
jgi:hypothetical protein